MSQQDLTVLAAFELELFQEMQNFSSQIIKLNDKYENQKINQSVINPQLINTFFIDQLQLFDVKLLNQTIQNDQHSKIYLKQSHLSQYENIETKLLTIQQKISQTIQLYAENQCQQIQERTQDSVQQLQQLMINSALDFLVADKLVEFNQTSNYGFTATVDNNGASKQLFAFSNKKQLPVKQVLIDLDSTQ
ncbi:hypothetical protein SS50377_20147 [Spironucleus salmonicida]|uniref:Uncharacterized protein n=1 Tax=Spironucleus salmonicida TaxID=348837 RepID=V6LKX4_9EUKA|nr:hypothetical protein SS50377_20147 [Spironucleus salmonicida]|eukprot:EST45202.1 Hypothetical protein SS50377_14774 [Spironucleus salmonicida]